MRINCSTVTSVSEMFHVGGRLWFLLCVCLCLCVIQEADWLLLETSEQCNHSESRKKSPGSKMWTLEVKAAARNVSSTLSIHADTDVHANTRMGKHTVLVCIFCDRFFSQNLDLLVFLTAAVRKMRTEEGRKRVRVRVCECFSIESCITAPRQLCEFQPN